MDDRIEDYANRQRKFWNVPNRDAARFDRVYTLEDRSEEGWRENTLMAVSNVIEGLQPRPDWRVLEIGCGVGRLLRELRDRLDVSKFIGVDISEQMIRFAGEDLGTDERIELHVNSGYDLSMIEDQSIDFVYSVDVFIHIFDFEIVSNYLKEVFRVLKMGGVFRFNVRSFDPDKAFSNSVGGRLAKLSYKVGLRSTARHVWNTKEAAEFNGNQYTLRDVEKLIKSSGMDQGDIQLVGSHFWCTAVRPTE